MDTLFTLDELQLYVNNIFDEEQYVVQPKELYIPIEYTMRQSGKRLRPTMLLAAYQMFGENVAYARDAAIAIEMFHNFTLLHDDLMDQSVMRRGKETVYKKWDANTAVLSGDTMLVLAYKHLSLQMQRAKDPLSILDTFNRTAEDVMRGQQYDINFESRDDITAEQYLDMIYLKTAALFNGALSIGAILANASGDDIARLTDYGTHLGLAFQIQDDLLDTYGDLSVLGKKPGQDICDNKKTLLLVTAMHLASDSQRTELHRWMSSKPDDPKEKIECVKRIFDELNIAEEMERQIQNHYDLATQALDSIYVPEQYKQPLHDLTRQLLSRKK